MSGRLFLARHAESISDAEQRYGGNLNPDLSDRGDQETAALAFSFRLYRTFVFDYIFSSPLVAAKKTAEVVSRRVGVRNSIEFATELDERDYGDLTGLTYAEALVRFGEESVARRAHGDYSSDDPLAKAMIEFYRVRLVPLIARGFIILVVSYDDNVRALAAHIDNTKIERERWRTGMSVEYRFDDDMKVASRDTVQAWKWD